MRDRLRDERAHMLERANELERNVPAARAARRVYDHDREVGGELIAGAIAFRAFVFTLPFVLVIVLLLGIIAGSSASGAAHVSKVAGITGIAAQSVQQASKVSSGSRWIVLVVGLYALYTTSGAMARVVRVAHALAWGDTVQRVRKGWRQALAVTAAVLLTVLLITGVSRLRHAQGGIGLAALLASIGVYTALWLFLSVGLPHADAPWTALIPGAIAVAVGIVALHALSVYYVTRKVSSASQLYGSLGAAVAILGWTYLVGRLIVFSAVLNSTLWSQRRETAVKVTTPSPARDTGG